MTAKPSSSQHGIKDNHTRGKVADFLGAKLAEGMDAKTVAAEIFHPRHTLYGQLFELQALEVVRLIEGEA